MKLMKKYITPILATSLLGAAGIAAQSSAFAAGGGGGGGGGASPSQNAPRYDAAAEYQKGIEALQAENFKKAVSAFRRSITAAPQNAGSHYFLGVSYMGQEKYKKASKSLKKAIKINGNMIEAHRDLAISYHKFGENEKAQSVLADLESLNERCAGTCAENAKLTNAISSVKTIVSGDQAVLNIRGRLANINAQNADTKYVAAIALINEKQYDKAISELQLAAKNIGPHPDILTYLGFANRKLRDFETAENYYKQALAVDPNHLGANEYFGELMIERGDINGAKSQLAILDSLCDFGCYEAEELRRWINAAT